MKTMIKNMLRRPLHAVLCTACLMASGIGFTSCEDFFEQESTHVIFDGDNPLNSTADTLYSVIGIINKMQAIADRTILLGEARADLVDINQYTSADLRELALFEVDAENIYNQPRDYYAIINNCNYFIANVDTSLYDNRNNQVFIREYAAVKAYRAWTYLQLVLNYGNVPFITEPILTKEEGDREYPRKGITEICNWLIQDIQPLADIEIPQYGKIRSVDSRLLYFPIYLLLGELNLWAGNDKEAALNYYYFLSKFKGVNSTFPTGTNNYGWYNSTTKWSSINIPYEFSNEYYGDDLITMLPGDSIPSEGYYSQLRNIFNSNEQNEFRVSLVPSQSLINLSASQHYCDITESRDTIYAPTNMENLGKYLSGDLRLYGFTLPEYKYIIYNNERIEAQYIRKYETRNIHIYRHLMVYLRLAEAMNAAGYPRFAYHILAGGLNNEVLEENIIPYYRNDSTFLRQFDFPETRYVLNTPEGTGIRQANTIGLHDRGSGWSIANEYYQMPNDTTIQDSLALIAYQQEAVERMIVDEGALEFAFEGLRYYDLMRVAMRRNDPAFLADRIYARRGEENSGSMKGEIKADLYNQENWYLNWNGEIGITVTNKEENK